MLYGSTGKLGELLAWKLAQAYFSAAFMAAVFIMIPLLQAQEAGLQHAPRSAGL